MGITQGFVTSVPGSGTGTNTYRVVTRFRGDGYTWSEAHFTPQLTPAQLGTAVTRMLSKRSGCLYTVHEFDSVRVSEVDVGTINLRQIRKAVSVPPGEQTIMTNGQLVPITVPRGGTMEAVSTRNGPPDQVRACLNMRAFFGGDRYVTKYFGGVSDLATGFDPDSVTRSGDPKWYTNVREYLSELLDNGWALRARYGEDLDPFIEILSWVKASAAPMNIGFLIAAGSNPFDILHKVQVSNVTKKTPTTYTVNGQYKVYSIDTTSFPGKIAVYLDGSSQVDVGTIKKPGRARPVHYNFFPYQYLTFVRAGIHRRGNRSSRPAGRRKTYVSADA